LLQYRGDGEDYLALCCVTAKALGRGQDHEPGVVCDDPGILQPVQCGLEMRDQPVSICQLGLRTGLVELGVELCRQPSRRSNAEVIDGRQRRDVRVAALLLLGGKQRPPAGPSVGVRGLWRDWYGDD
jgi:hypothetical protein